MVDLPKLQRALLFALPVSLALVVWQPALAGGSGDEESGEKAEARPHPLEEAALSRVAFGGYRIFQQNCSGCHGELADGSAQAISLLDKPYARDLYLRELLHQSFRDAAAVHKAASKKRKRFKLSFNQLEMVGKYLRELYAWRSAVAAVNKAYGED